MRPPVYPFVLGAACAVAGHCATTGRVLNALLGTLAAALIGLLAGRLWGRRAGLAALGVAAVATPLVLEGNTLLTETAFDVALLATVLAALHARGRGWAWAGATGALAGLAVLTRPNGAALLLPVLAALALGVPGRARLLRPAAALAVAALVVAPWTIRNAVVLHHFVPVSTSSGYTLAGTYNDTSRLDRRFPGAWRPADLDPAYRRLLARTARDDEVERGAALGRAARRYAERHPGYVPSVIAHNLARFTQLGGAVFGRLSAESDGLTARQADLARVGWLVLAALAIAALALGALRGTPAWLWCVPLVLLASVAPVVSAIRFRNPVDVFVVLLAGYAVARIAPPRRRAEPPPRHA